MKKVIKTFDKLIDVKEREKESILQYHNQLEERCEAEGNKLFQLLTKREKAKEHLSVLVSKGKVDDIQKQSRYLDYLGPIILKQETIYKQTKDALHIEKLKLKQKNIEQKKYEKVKEKKIEAFQHHMKERESKEMDEISINQFMKSRVMA